jgi:hypothetical protein
VQGQQASSRGELGDKLQKRDAGGAGLFETVAGADQRWEMQMCKW